MSHHSPTIAAPITAPGQAAVSIIRISGPKTREVLLSLLSQAEQIIAQPRRLFLADISFKQELLDRGLVVFFAAPNSYTGEDSAEFNLHGSSYLVSRLLEVLRNLGVSLARPGEFTERAYLNGQMDLSQAEAVADLIAAQTALQARSAQEQLEGALAHAMSELGEPLRNLLCEIEALIDFPEEDSSILEKGTWLLTLNKVQSKLDDYLASFRVGRLCREGADIVLAGAPNAGKSSLLNALTGENRAIVTPIPGTTRDSIEGQVNLHGLFVRLWDTAGLADDELEVKKLDEVEQLGIIRSWEKARDADLILFVFDAALPIAAQLSLWRKVIELGRSVVPTLNKTDLLGKEARKVLLTELAKDNISSPYFISALTKEGLSGLALALRDMIIGSGAAPSASLLITNRRHFEALARAEASLEDARSGIENQVSPELVALEIRSALNALDDIIGITTSEDILGRIFSRFCIGK